MARYSFTVPPGFHRRRLDEFLFARFGSLSKAYIRGVLKRGACELNGYKGDAGAMIRENDFIEIEAEEKMELGMRPREMPLEVLFEDRCLIVVNKPCGMLVHPTNYEKNGTLLNGLAFHVNRSRNSGDEFVRPHLVHRLDKETSGIVLAAKDASTARRLCDHFRRGLFEKRYVAVVDGIVGRNGGEIDKPIGRDPGIKRWNVMKEGKRSVTRFSVLDRMDRHTLLELEPVTGRTNQLRIHCASIGHPIKGDSWHGGSECTRLCLHASLLDFWHPQGGRRVRIAKAPAFPEV